MSEQTNTYKAEVYYQGPIRISEGWYRNEDDPIKYVAHLQVVLNHPRLGVCTDVRTSEIVVWPDVNGNFETRNTKYIRKYIKSAPEDGIVNGSN